MTTTQSTPTVCIVGKDERHANSFSQRISTFASGHELNEAELLRSPNRVVHDVATHVTAWLVVANPSMWSPQLIQLASDCRNSNAGFRCLVLVDMESSSEALRSIWPDQTIFLSDRSLSTTIIDKLRSETHANRIANHRRRQIERLSRRSV